MTTNTLPPFTLKSAVQTAEAVTDFLSLADKILAFFEASPKIRKEVKIALGIMIAVAIAAYLYKLYSK